MNAKWKIVKNCANGRIWKNKIPFHGAFVFMNPNMGFIRIAFGNGMNAPCDDDDEEDRFDENGNELDDNIYITTYCGEPIEDSWKPDHVHLGLDGHPEKRSHDGLLFEEDDGFNLTFSRKTHPKGDLREFVREALECMGWPSWDPAKYWLWGVE